MVSSVSNEPDLKTLVRGAASYFRPLDGVEGWNFSLGRRNMKEPNHPAYYYLAWVWLF
jgi:hypothetical protein